MTKYSESTSKTMMRNEDLKMDYVFLLIELISELYKLMSDVEGIPLSKSEGSSGEQAGKSDGSGLDVVNAGLEVPAETSAEGDPVMTKLNAISNQITEMNSSLQAKGERTPAEDDLTEIKEALMRIEGALGLGDITAALEELRAELQNIVGPKEEGEEVATTGEKLNAIEAKPADNEVKLEERIKDLGVEVRDSKRSIISEIDSVKSALEALIKEIEKKAMTFDQIYKKLCVTIVREHRNATGRIIGR
ncbi:MAG: hypothetical protein JW984_09475 [Deltaproteobacteria bacterium]|uniref:Uncharacterized protein n=1 Tax=Candidatus Zymogenus saltonus TaxID=2844893 RepID=A0A9D8PQ24_9DELT|nr:hypothetical protein [Candidatus Zymogenus saltonus]